MAHFVWGRLIGKLSFVKALKKANMLQSVLAGLKSLGLAIFLIFADYFILLGRAEFYGPDWEEYASDLRAMLGNEMCIGPMSNQHGGNGGFLSLGHHSLTVKFFYESSFKMNIDFYQV